MFLTNFSTYYDVHIATLAISNSFKAMESSPTVRLFNVLAFRLILKVRKVKSEGEHTSQQQTQLCDLTESPDQEPVEPVRYIAAEVKKSSTTDHEPATERELKAKASLPSLKKDDYEAVEMEQQDIYEETF